MEEQVIINKHLDEQKDSFEWGTPGKAGCIKVYGDYNKETEFKAKIEKALTLRKEFNEKLANEQV